MFIVSKKNFLIHRSNGETYKIQKGMADNIPDDVAQNWLIQAAVSSGSIITPESTKDKAIYKADEEAEKKAEVTDIRQDANVKESNDQEEPDKEEKTEKPGRGKK